MIKYTRGWLWNLGYEKIRFTPHDGRKCPLYYFDNTFKQTYACNFRLPKPGEKADIYIELGD